MVVLLAMAFELPVFSTNVYGIPEIINTNNDGILFEPGDFIKLSQLMNNFIKEPNIYKMMGKKANSKVWRLFNNKVLAKDHLELIKRGILT